MNLVSTIWRDERGQDLIEYALMAGFIAVAAGALVPAIGEKVKGIFQKVNDTLGSAAPTSS